MDLEHFDKFENAEVYWVDVSRVPERLVEEAKRIDGADYSGECFGVCIQRDKKTGNLHWLDYRLTEQEVEKIVRKIIMIIEGACGEGSGHGD